MAEPNFNAAYRWTIFQYVGAIMIPLFFFQFVMEVLNLKKSTLVLCGYVTAVGLQLLSLFGLLEGIEPHPPYTYFTVPGPFYWIFVIYFFAFALYAHWLLWRGMRSAKGRLRNQIKFILVGTGIGFAGGSTSFFLVFNIPIPPYGVYAVPAYIITVSYAIFKHQLMDINVVIRRTLVYSFVSAVLASLYAAIVVLCVHFLEGIVQSATMVSSAIVACLMGILFHPIARWFQAWVDDRFSRKRIDHESRLMEFSSEVAGEENLEKMTRSLFQIVEDALHPTSIALYLQPEGESDFQQVSPDAEIALPKRLPAFNAWSEYFSVYKDPLLLDLRAPGAASTKNPSDETVLKEMVQARLSAAFPLLHQRSLLGFLLLGEKQSGQTYSDEDRRLIQIVMNQAALAYERPKLLQEITGAFVHEIKMPLANISLPAELTFMDLTDIEAGRKSIGDVVGKMKSRMKYIMDQALLAGGRVEAIQEISASQNFVQGEVDLAAAVRASVQALDGMARASNTHVELVRLSTSVPVLGNAKQLEIVFVNFIKNALEAMAGLDPLKERKLCISLVRSGSDVVIEIADSGPGIASGHLSSLFRSHFTTKGTHGTGLGLYIARQIIKSHHGSIEVRSEEGKGTTFSVRLPSYAL